VRKPAPWVPPGLDDPRWDFSPKEEPPPEERTATSALSELVSRWAEGLGGFFGIFAIWGAVRARALRERIAREAAERGQAAPEPPGRLRWLLTVYISLYALVLVRHLAILGYISDRHLLPLVALALPWAAGGLSLCGRRIAELLGWPARKARRVAVVLVLAAVAATVMLPLWKPGHRSRWGHWAAGQWLRAHAQPSEAVLDTRGWAAFISDRASYDYWHVRQALTDAHLAYIVVGDDELSSSSRRGATLRAILAYAAAPVAAFPEEKNRAGIGVRVYRFRCPVSWEGLRP
jgi:hypothetical protein